MAVTLVRSAHLNVGLHLGTTVGLLTLIHRAVATLGTRLAATTGAEAATHGQNGGHEQDGDAFLEEVLHIMAVVIVYFSTRVISFTR